MAGRFQVLAVIPARGGSKGIPNKNIEYLAGAPLIAYSIATAQASEAIDSLVVSTDDLKICEVAQSYGAEVIMRPAEYATDESPTELALIHVLDTLLDKGGYIPDIVLTLEPTSPLRTTEIINRCVKIFETTDADSVIGVVETRSCYGKIVNGKYEFLFPGQPRRRQDREPLYREGSFIYGTRTEALRAKKSVLGDNLYPLVVQDREVHDINDHFDFEIAEALMKKRKNTEGAKS